MKTILIPTNFTDIARHATDYAILLYGKELDRIILLKAFEQPRTGRSLQFSLVDILRRNSEKGLHEDRLRIEEEFPDLKCEIDERPTQGDLSASIRSVLDTDNVDLIVMGSKGDREFVDIFVESIAARVIRNIDHPMLIVPPIASLHNNKSIIFATDLKPITDQTVVSQLKDLCHIKQAGIKVLHISKTGPHPSEKAESMIREIFPGIGLDFNYRKNSDIPSGIYKFIHETDADILTLVRRRGAGSLVERLFQKNISHIIYKYVRQTLLLLNDQDYPARA
jgi:nucleotide-binding universal stress UspA family protein